MVRVYFLTSMNNDHAWDVVSQLTRYVQDGELKLSSQGRVLHVPPQNVSYLILPDSGQVWKFNLLKSKFHLLIFPGGDDSYGDVYFSRRDGHGCSNPDNVGRAKRASK